MTSYRDNLVYTTDYRDAYANADVIFIGVGTPERKDGSANLDYVRTVARQIAESAEKNCVVVIKSTVPIGTNYEILAHIKEHLTHDITVEIASNPEFLAQGTAVRDTLHAARIVIGTETPYAKKVLTEIYETFACPLVQTDIKSAEMIKYASNDFLALKISYINEIANLCEIMGANIEDVSKGMGLDPRIGNHFLSAGIGYGGSCFPKDTKALHWLGNFHDYELKTIKAAIEVNESQKLRLFKKSRKYYDSLKNKKVAVLGLTFKPNTDDLREAPSLENIPLFLDLGADVYAWDPVGTENFKKHFPTEITYCDTIDDAIRDADICFIFTEWKQVKEYDPNNFVALMHTPIVLDGRNCYDLDVMKKLPVNYESVGRTGIIQSDE
jgi:UDPglucose 6-dehydrogenase